jgi:hypothetical protein
MMFKEMKGGNKNQLLSHCFCKRNESTIKGNKTLFSWGGGLNYSRILAFGGGSEDLTLA